MNYLIIEFKQSWHDEYLEWICEYADAYDGYRITSA